MGQSDFAQGNPPPLANAGHALMSPLAECIKHPEKWARRGPCTVPSSRTVASWMYLLVTSELFDVWGTIREEQAEDGSRDEKEARGRNDRITCSS